MTTAVPIAPDLTTVLRRLKLSGMLDTLPSASPSPASRRCRTPTSCSWS